MKTLSDCLIAKKELEQSILKLIKNFEETYGVHVSSVSTDSSYRIESPKLRVYSIECKVEL